MKNKVTTQTKEDLIKENKLLQDEIETLKSLVKEIFAILEKRLK
jgi:hypothetical protein